MKAGESAAAQEVCCYNIAITLSDPESVNFSMSVNACYRQLCLSRSLEHDA